MLRRLISHPNKKAWLLVSQAKRTQNCFVIFGDLAVMAAFAAVDPWLCVAGFRRVCLYRMLSCDKDYIIKYSFYPCNKMLIGFHDC
jgi:hypothetical protein